MKMGRMGDGILIHIKWEGKISSKKIPFPKISGRVEDTISHLLGEIQGFSNESLAWEQSRPFPWPIKEITRRTHHRDCKVNPTICHEKGSQANCF